MAVNICWCRKRQMTIGARKWKSVVGMLLSFVTIQIIGTGERGSAYIARERHPKKGKEKQTKVVHFQSQFINVLIHIFPRIRYFT